MLGFRTMMCGNNRGVQHRIHAGQCLVGRFLKLTSLAAFVWVAFSTSLPAQSSGNDSGAPNMTGVTDVTPGWKYLLRNDDLVMLQANFDGSGNLTTSLVTMKTANSAISGTPTTININTSNPNLDPSLGGVPVSQASGRVFNTATDSVAILYPVNNGWGFALANSGGVQASSRLTTSIPPVGKVFTHVVMGDFNGDGLADPLVIYENSGYNANPVPDFQWGMKVITASSEPPVTLTFAEGPEFAAATQANGAIVPETVVVGDFNGDGRDDIAALLADYQTVQFFTVDPKTLAITKSTTVSLSANFPGVATPNITMVPGQVALAAGHFRQCGTNGNPCQANGITNADVVVFGQISTIGSQSAAYGYSVIPVKVTPGSAGSPLTAAAVTQKGATQAVPFFQLPNYAGSSGALAQAAPLAFWPQQTDEQLVLGVRTENGSSYILIGSFLPDDGTMQTFDWESETQRKYRDQYDELQNLWVGNFDNLDLDGKTHKPGLQIETYEYVGIDNPAGHINIFNVNVPSPFPSNPPAKTDWLDGQQQSDNTSNIPSYNPDVPSTGILSPADMQGRSLRLGSPTIVRIPAQTQPDLVLAIPPMHVDFIAPNDSALMNANKVSGGCTDVNVPCIVNISTVPSKPPSAGTGFATSFAFSSSDKSTSDRSSVTSWGLSTKTSAGSSVTFNDGLTNATASIKNTSSTAHNSTVKKTFGSYSGTSQSLSATTGLSDYLYFTQKAMNVYYYPVLGCEGASSGSCWVNGQQVPMFVQFSVPDQVRYSDIDGLNQDWYQPLHEPGNIFSYPANMKQLQAGYKGTVNSLTSPSVCKAIGSGTSIYSTTWPQGPRPGRSSGSTNSFSDELSMSYSTGAGISGIDSANVSFGLDIAGSTSLNTLNESSTSMSTSKAISVNLPAFEPSAKCCSYAFSGFVFSLQNLANPPSEKACTTGQTPDKDGCIAVNDPDQQKPVDVAGNGPLIVGFTADPISGQNAELSCAGNASWWQTVYTKPDIALNHPGRWNWNKTQQVASFVAADSTNIVEDNYFYLMKDFFVSKKSAAAGPTLAEASPTDALTLTTRIYNYSLVDSTAPVHVRFYGQLYCSTNSGTGDPGCKNGGATCKIGLCGDSFQVGSDQVIASIAGFRSPTAPTNWTTATVDFLPSNYGALQSGNVYLVFWVVTWMQDGNGAVVAEMPGHGLKSIPAATLKQITDVPFEPYSNNVGLYGAHQRFYLCPSGGCAAATASAATASAVTASAATATAAPGSLKTIGASIPSPLTLGKNGKVVTTLEVTGAAVGPVNIAYYDGDPSRGGVLLDIQKIQRMEPDATYSHRALFTPETCGAPTIYAGSLIELCNRHSGKFRHLQSHSKSGGRICRGCVDDLRWTPPGSGVLLLTVNRVNSGSGANNPHHHDYSRRKGSIRRCFRKSAGAIVVVVAGIVAPHALRWRPVASRTVQSQEHVSHDTRRSPRICRHQWVAKRLRT
jgi:hypothetical protein